VGSNTAIHLVIFNFSGFFRPVDNPPVLNVVKAGWIIPVRFSLNGYQGLNIFAPGYPKSQIIACSATAQEVDVDETTATSPGLLIYNPFTDRYIYIWKTDKSWAGTCRQLIVTLTDGTTHVANFKFK
ncbi:MAG TPA: PxKF domain-containing protein, partial [Anaerolineae bacterium]|nr:PxKF domain-containing protein [Anaerolineae bacterium]